MAKSVLDQGPADTRGVPGVRKPRGRTWGAPIMSNIRGGTKGALRSRVTSWNKLACTADSVEQIGPHCSDTQEHVLYGPLQRAGTVPLSWRIRPVHLHAFHSALELYSLEKVLPRENTFGIHC
jgi:hypothetical protein